MKHFYKQEYRPLKIKFLETANDPKRSLELLNTYIAEGERQIFSTDPPYVETGTLHTGMVCTGLTDLALSHRWGLIEPRPIKPQYRVTDRILYQPEEDIQLGEDQVIPKTPKNLDFNAMYRLDQLAPMIEHASVPETSLNNPTRTQAIKDLIGIEELKYDFYLELSRIKGPKYPHELWVSLGDDWQFDRNNNVLFWLNPTGTARNNNGAMAGWYPLSEITKWVHGGDSKITP